MDNLSIKLLSEITVFNKYSKYIPELGRRETWEELCERNVNMHVKKYPDLKEEIEAVYRDFVLTKKILPSMRSMQFAGKPIELSPNRIYNCCYLPINDRRAFSEIMFLLLGGTGVGYSVQRHHVAELPPVKRPVRSRRFVVGDSIEGWADAVKALVSAYLDDKPLPKFDFSDIRPKGAALVTSGGKAPGPEPLKDCLHNLQKILDRKADGEQLTTLEVHDMVCYVADAVLAGGIRRAALICLFNIDDDDMLTCKFGNWYELNPQRARANNSAVVMRHKVKKKDFLDLWTKIRASNAGEPGIYFSNNSEWGANPCKPLNATILTKNGYVTFEQALGMDELEVITPDGKIAKASKPFKTGSNRNVWRMTLSNGTYLYGTENHQHMTQDGVWKRMDEMSVGDCVATRLYPVNDICISNQNDYDYGMLAGWVHGDGSWYERSDRASGEQISLCFGNHETDVAQIFADKFGFVIKPHHQKPETCLVANTKRKELCDKLKSFGATLDKENIDWLYLTSPSFKLGFIRALFTADGSVRKQNQTELYSTRREALEVIGNILREFGIYNSISIHGNSKTYVAPDGKERNNATCYKIIVSAGMFKKIGFLSTSKTELLQSQEEKSLYRYNDYLTIKKIDRNYSIEDVYDITVYDDSHAFMDNSVVTHNCVEIALRPFQFCNLVEVNFSNIESQADLNARSKAAAFIATLQAGYTDFHYLRDIWKRTTEKDALIGVSGTGIASGEYLKYDLKEAAKVVADENARVAKIIGIKTAARQTCVKPAGTTSLVLGTSSGIHAWFDQYYIRRMKLGKNEALYKYLIDKLPALIEDDFFKPTLDAFVKVPVAAPEGAIIAPTETALQLLERVKFLSENWVAEGHHRGDNSHNVSATVYIKPDEWDEVGEWMWKYRDIYNGLSVLPFDGGTYTQAPHESITREVYEEMLSHLTEIDLADVAEVNDNTSANSEIACAGGACEVQY